MNDRVSRRSLLKATGIAGAALATSNAVAQDAGATAGQAHAVSNEARHQPQNSGFNDVLYFFTDPEARFVQAAVDRLIPADTQWGGAKEAGVLYFIDKQLASAYGAGAHMFLKGPWDTAAPPEQGYQLRFSPADLYRTAIDEIGIHARRTYNGNEFWELGAAVIDEVLAALESGQVQLPSLPSPVFFETLLANTVEGFFSDPAYGGNRDMISWRMVGFPGAYAQYLELVDQYGYRYERQPISFGNEAARQAHIHAHDSSAR